MAGSTKIKTAEKLTDTIDADCQDLLGLAGARIFSNLQCLCPDLDLLNVLQRVREATPCGTSDRETIARAFRVDTAITVTRYTTAYCSAQV
jgi:hypothetical protein